MVLKMCAVVYRKELEDAINNNSGDYRGNLTKDVTHLVAKEASGQKYNFALQWGITTVAVEWLEQSLERGMILDETLYQLSVPPGDRGRNAWIRRSNSNTSLGKRTREDEVVPPNARKLRRTASARLSSQNVGLWSELVTVPIKIEQTGADAWDEQQEEVAHSELALKKPVSEDLECGRTDGNVRQALKKSFSEASLGSSLGRPHSKEGLFHGKCLLLRGFDEQQVRKIRPELFILTLTVMVQEYHIARTSSITRCRDSPRGLRTTTFAQFWELMQWSRGDTSYEVYCRSTSRP